MPGDRECRNNSGFTLVEMMVALALLSVMFISLYGFFLSGVIVWHRSQDKAEVEENLRIGINRLARELRQAKGIVSFNSTCGGKLIFTGSDGSSISYFRSTSGDAEQAYQLTRAVNGAGNNPVARYIREISVEPADCGTGTGMVTVTLMGEKGRSGKVTISTTITLRKTD